MASDPNATRAAQAGKTVTTSDGYQIVYDENGFGRKSVSPTGETKYYDPLGNQTSTPYDGPSPKAQSTAAQAESAQAETPLSPVKQVTPTSEVIPEVQADGGRVSENSQELEPSSDSQLSPYGEENDKPEIPEEQATINPDEDPFEAERLKAQEASDNEGPTEQAVIDAKQDAKLSQEEEGQLREFQESQRALLKEQSNQAGNPEGNWTASSVNQVRAAQTIAVARNTINQADWRIRLSLAPGTSYLYNQAGPGDILFPLKSTDGIIFPYSPTIQTAYRANYDATDVTHSNYKMYFYKNSNVDEITLTADFTAQDTAEANYMLAMIHFFRSVTKMFYGQDGNNGPRAGTPPPLCYLNGYGQYQFNEHPVLISNFSYTLPNDVDYIRAGSVTVAPGTNKDSYQKSNPSSSAAGSNLMTKIRTAASGLADGFLSGLKKAAANGNTKGTMSSDPKWIDRANKEATYVPTKLQITLTLLPIVTRNDISKNFSLEKYAKGELLKGRSRPSGGGIW